MTGNRVDTVVHGGLVATSTDAYEASVAIQGERIAAVGPRELMPEAETYIDAGGKLVLPGAIDAHVHLRPSPGDDWTVGPVAAAHAGLTTIIPFAEYDNAGKETLPRAIARITEEAAGSSVVDFAMHFILANDPYIVEELPEALRMGVTSYKMFMTYKKAITRMCSDAYIARVMEIVGAAGGLVQLHCENGDVIDHLEDRAIAEGRTHPRDFPATCPPWAEEEAINRAIRLADMAGCPVYVVHLSTQAGLERIKEAQGQGQRVWTETCPQYLLLTEAEMERLGPLAKIGPPLRPADGVNQEAMWRAPSTATSQTSAATTHPPPGSARSRAGRTSSWVPMGSPSPSGRRPWRRWCLWPTAREWSREGCPSGGWPGCWRRTPPESSASTRARA